MSEEAPNPDLDLDRELARARKEMVLELKRRGIKDERLLAAMLKVPRHLFISRGLWHLAYGDHPLPIAAGQTISQPYIVALMVETLAVRQEDRVLEIGTGSGYETALLAELAAEVYTVERVAELLEGAERLLSGLGYRNIRFHLGDGTQGWADHAPYDRIIASGSVPQVPHSLIFQLADPGRLVIPVGDRHLQEVVLLQKAEGEIFRERLVPCSFLPLIGEEGWRN
ncbi:TPA: protein-L-isoaspartate(D-aspartate) O-methyltransferase [Candidatus Bipolaricaulota bacterium]|nr:protein-L-isoaspartate(D-aspartate) O-methyltransferase [Candidatus Bipolaricaulota bacterium]